MDMQFQGAPRLAGLPSGPADSIADVAGVSVGHCTLADGPIQTGVTVLRPHSGDTFVDKVPCAVSVINGFGKSVGLVQVQELGVLETPIALTNTFGVGTVANAQIRQAITAHPQIGREWPTINPLVLECNDGYLNDIQRMPVREQHYMEAFASCSTQVQQGAVGAGRGMSAFTFKGGIGTASRLAISLPGACGHAGSDAPGSAQGTVHTVGALVLANFGKLPNLVVAGRALGQRYMRELAADQTEAVEKGSIILVLATDAPLDARQLRRLAARAGAGLARTGSFYGHGSGDIALAFSTAYTLPHLPQRPAPAVAFLHETCLDPLFDAAAQACEQAILSAMWSAQTVHGRDGHVRYNIREAMPLWRQWLDEGCGEWL